jgi:GNAT superfamily N-acetyltransferase
MGRERLMKREEGRGKREEGRGKRGTEEGGREHMTKSGEAKRERIKDKAQNMGKAHLMAIHRAQFPANQQRAIGKEYYEWKVYKNPVMKGDIHFEIRDGRTVGSAVVMPRKVANLDDIVLAAETADTFTVPEFCGQGINTKILGNAIDWAISHGMHLVYGPPNKANYGTHIRLGYKTCEYIGWASLMKSLNPMWFALKLIAKIILGKQVQKSVRHLRYLSKRLITGRQFIESRQNSSKNDYTIMQIDRFTNEVDPLWGKPRYSFFVYRDKEYLNWRYFDNPDKFIVLAALKGKDCLGYSALKLSNDKRTGILCDFVAMDDRSDVFLALVSESEKILKQNGADQITLRCIADSPYYNDLMTLDYYNTGPESHHPVFINARTETGKRILENPGRWHFTYGDTDEV